MMSAIPLNSFAYPFFDTPDARSARVAWLGVSLERDCRLGYDAVELVGPRVAPAGESQEHYYLVLNRTAVIARKLR